jgi:DNA-binding CsgD family transcriptional regulator
MDGTSRSEAQYERVARLHFDISQSVYAQMEVPEVEMYRLFLNTFSLGDFFCFVYFLPEQKLEYCSDGIEKILGIAREEFGLGFLIENMHPEDLDGYAQNESALYHVLKTIPPEKLTRYKARQDFRVKTVEGSYKRLLHQVLILQHDSDGAIIRTYGITTDISPYKMDGEMRVDLIGLHSEPTYIDIQPDGTYSEGFQILSPREFEILQGISKGKSSPEIAEELNISISTVNNHRKKILHKTHTTSTLELIQEGLAKGWI